MKINEIRPKPKHVIFKFEKYRDKEKNPKGSKTKKSLSYKER